MNPSPVTALTACDMVAGLLLLLLAVGSSAAAPANWTVWPDSSSSFADMPFERSPTLSEFRYDPANIVNPGLAVVHADTWYYIGTVRQIVLFCCISGADRSIFAYV